jgi:hypothetical protein
MWSRRHRDTAPVAWVMFDRFEPCPRFEPSVVRVRIFGLEGVWI